MVHPDHRDNVHGFVERARANGDTIVRGGQPSATSLHYEPTLIEPKSNDSEGGAARDLWTRADVPDLRGRGRSDRAGQLNRLRIVSHCLHRVSHSRRTGGRRDPGRPSMGQHVFVRDLTAPFGGCGISGIGREGRRLRARIPQRSQDVDDRAQHDVLSEGFGGLTTPPECTRVRGNPRTRHDENERDAWAPQ